MGLGRSLERITIGGLFVGHGTQKLFGWFGGGGVEETAQQFDSLGLRPPRRHTVAAGLAEAGGGTLLAAGLATPAAAALLSGVMFTAISKVHWKNGPWNSQGGYEYNLALIDHAIATTRDAARKNPKDEQAAQFMFAAYQSKVDLMNQITSARTIDR